MRARLLRPAGSNEQGDGKLGALAVGVVGAGFIGSGIAASSALAGKQVFLYEPEEAPLARSRQAIADINAAAAARGRLGPLRQPRSRTGSTTRRGWRSFIAPTP